MPKGNGKAIAKVKVDKTLSPGQSKELLETLKARFEDHMNRHKELKWDDVQKKLKANPEKLKSLNAMENTGGEPDVISLGEKASERVFVDCSAETPSGRRSICYDHEGEQMRIRKGIHPAGNAVELAKEMGIELLDEEQYRELQNLGEFDLKTSSWIKTPGEIRKLGGALFCDRRYNTVFVYHNGAESFYSARGFRGMVRIA